MNIRWWPDATLALLNMSRAEAVAIDRAVQAFAASGEGVVIHVEGEFRLFVGEHVVSFLIEGETLHVDRIRRV